MHKFSKYSMPNFNDISSIDSKYDTINKFYKDLVKLNDANSQHENTKENKMTVLKTGSLLYYELTNMY